MADIHKIHSELDRAYSESHCVDETISGIRWILFSDHHRGRKDGADDFKPCEDTYSRALDYYYDKDYTLALVGDVEEFWENPLWTVLRRYKEILRKEKKFYTDKRLYRIWGNHDDAWRYKDLIKRYLGDWLPNIRIHEGLSISFNEVDSDKNIFLVHGHQGNLESDRYSWISKIFVRLIWRNIQRIFRVPLSTPATDHKLKSVHDSAMHYWTKINETILICGHTHETVFMSKNNHPDLKASYFNTGCCSYGNGNITGIELADEKIRLVTWIKGEDKKTIIHEANLIDILS